MPRRCCLLHAKYCRGRLGRLGDLLHYSKSIGAVKAVSVPGEPTEKVQRISLPSTAIMYFAVAFGCSRQRIATQCARQCGNTEQSYSLPQKVHKERRWHASKSIAPNVWRTSSYSYFTTLYCWVKKLSSDLHKLLLFAGFTSSALEYPLAKTKLQMKSG